MAVTILDQSTIENLILARLGMAIEENTNEIVVKAKQDIENAIRKSTANLAMELLKHYSVETHGTTMVIRVHNDRS